MRPAMSAGIILRHPGSVTRKAAVPLRDRRGPLAASLARE